MRVPLNSPLTVPAVSLLREIATAPRLVDPFAPGYHLARELHPFGANGTELLDESFFVIPFSLYGFLLFGMFGLLETALSDLISRLSLYGKEVTYSHSQARSFD